MKYPQILFFRYEKYASLIDHQLNDMKNQLNCTIQIISDTTSLNKLFNTNYPVLVTYGPSEQEYHKDVFSVIPPRICGRWVHYSKLPEITVFNNSMNYCFIHNAIEERKKTRPIFSVFTTTYNSYQKIHRAYDSLKIQTLKDWEWVILDDSPDDNHFYFLRELFKDDFRVRLYRRSENSGNIGNVKNEAISLCRGKYVLEFDHDDEILPEVLDNATFVFEDDPEVGFVYMDFINIHENGNNFHYGDFLCKGYAGYYCQKYKDEWVNVYVTPNINNITMSHLVCCPNHPRIWRKETLEKIGSYSEFLPICDDYEILLRTACNTKMVKIHKLGYVQYMNDGNNNFSLIRNSEINRIGPQHIFPQFYEKYKVHEVMKEKDAFENPDFIFHHSKIWERDPSTYTNKYCNKIVNLDFEKQYCVIGYEILLSNIENIRRLYDEEAKSEFFILDSSMSKEQLCVHLDELGLGKMKCYAMKETTKKQWMEYFTLLLKSCEDYEIIYSVK